MLKLLLIVLCVILCLLACNHGPEKSAETLAMQKEIWYTYQDILHIFHLYTVKKSTEVTVS